MWCRGEKEVISQGCLVVNLWYFVFAESLAELRQRQRDCGHLIWGIRIMPCRGLRSRIVVSEKDTLRHSPLMVLGIAEEVNGMSEGPFGDLYFHVQL